MNVMIRMLMLILMLVPLSAPAVAAAPVAMAEQNVNMSMDHHHLAAEHACCDEADMAAMNAMAEHMSCDGSCSDCQHYCGATAVALLPSLSAAAALPEMLRWQYTSAHLLTRKDRLERPPMPAND